MSVRIMEVLVYDTFTADFTVHDKAQPGVVAGRESVK